MELLFESTRRFEKDLKSLPDREKKRVVAALNRYGSIVRKDPSASYHNAYRPLLLQLKGGLDATLYALRVGRDIRVILTVDEDPIFDQVIISLLRVVRHGELQNAFKGLAESLYQSMLNRIGGEGNSDG